MKRTLVTFSLLFFCTLSVAQGMRFKAPEATIPYNEGAEVLFRTPLPSKNFQGRNNGSYNNEEAGIPGVFSSENVFLGEMLHQLRNSIWDDRRLVFIDGRMIMCSKNWIRDHVHEMKAFKHWEYDLRSFIDFTIEHQRGDGCFYELVKQYDDYHWTFVEEPEYKLFPEDNLTMVRLEIESDIEYIMVEGAMHCYRVTGDGKWLEKVLPALEKGIDYLTSDPKRWDEERGLVKRGYTIDTWDFLNVPEAGTDRRITENTPVAIMHGDNSGVYQAMIQLAWMNERLGRGEQAARWKERAEAIRERMFRYLWNGRHFIHQLPLNCEPYDEYESVRLSLSNTYDINRGVTDMEQSGAIIEEYQARRDTTKAFAEWFSIDPPYAGRFGGYRPGRYVNGAISPFTAGELAKAALNNGYEQYGWDIIQRMGRMMERDGAIYFLYSPDDGRPQGGGPSAWGAAAFVSAIDEGLAGIVDKGVKYSSIAFSPRFPVSGYKELRYFTGYESSGVLVDLRYVLADNGLRYRLVSPAREIDAHIYIPEGKTVGKVRLNRKTVAFEETTVGLSHYVDLKIAGADGTADIEVIWK